MSFHFSVQEQALHTYTLLVGSSFGEVQVVQVLQSSKEALELVLEQKIFAQPGKVISLSWLGGWLASCGPNGPAHVTCLDITRSEDVLHRGPLKPKEMTRSLAGSEFSFALLDEDFLLMSGQHGLGLITWDGPEDQMDGGMKAMLDTTQGSCVAACSVSNLPNQKARQIELAIFQEKGFKYWAYGDGEPPGEPQTCPFLEAEILQLGFSGWHPKDSEHGSAGFLAAARTDGALHLWNTRRGSCLSLNDSQELPCSTSSTSFVQSLCWQWLDNATLLLFANAHCTVFQWELEVKIEKDLITADKKSSHPVLVGVHPLEVRGLCAGWSLKSQAVCLLASAAQEIQTWTLQKGNGVDARVTHQPLPPCLRMESALLGYGSLGGLCYTCLSFASPGILVAGSSDGCLSLFLVEEGEELHRLQSCHSSSISCLLTRPTCALKLPSSCSQVHEVFTAASDGSIAVWQICQTDGHSGLKRTLTKAKACKSLHARIQPLWQQHQRHHALSCSSADFQEVQGLTTLQRSILAQQGGCHLDLHRSLTIPRNSGQVSGVQVKLEPGATLRIVGFTHGGSIVESLP